MLRTFGIFAAVAAVLSVPFATSEAGAAPPPIDGDVSMPTSRPIGPGGEAAAGTTVPVEVVHVETDTSFGDMGTQGTVLFAETMAPTGSTPRGWWLRMDVTVRNISAQPIEITELGITTDATALAVEALDEPLVLAPGATELLKPHDVTGSGTPPTWFTVNVYAPAAAPFPAQASYPLEIYRNGTATGGYRFPARPEHLPAGVFWMPGSFHAHSRGQRYAYDLKAVRSDHDRHEWTRYTEGAYADEANGITLGSENEHHLVWGQPVYAMASGWSVSCRRSEPDHQPGGEHSVPGANVISIDHGNGEFAAYAHLMENTMPPELCTSEAPVDDEDPPLEHEPVYVHEGQFLGLVGNSGPSTGPHLHLHLADSGPETPSSSQRGLPLNFHDVFVHAYDGFDPTIHEPDWNWVTSSDAAAIGHRQLIHPNSCGWDPNEDIGGYTTGGRTSRPQPRQCDTTPDPLARPNDDRHQVLDEFTPRPQSRVSLDGRRNDPADARQLRAGTVAKERAQMRPWAQKLAWMAAAMMPWSSPMVSNSSRAKIGTSRTITA